MPSIKLPNIHRFDIQQGNIITQEMVDQLKPGMTKSQVRYIMGTPLVTDTFNADRWDYYYSLYPAKGEERRERMAILFENDLLVGFRGDYLPTEIQTAMGIKDDAAQQEVDAEDEEAEQEGSRY